MAIDTKVELASEYTVEDYQNDESNKNKGNLSDFIKKRLRERYIDSLTCEAHGFTQVALSCLLIETLESFRKGYEDSKGKCGAMFIEFFDTASSFSEMEGLGSEFFTNVRCGLLHQAETKGGWKIRKDVPGQFDEKTKTINAELFLKRIGDEIDQYSEKLKKESWDSKLWINFRKKMKFICENTGAN